MWLPHHRLIMPEDEEFFAPGLCSLMPRRGMMAAATGGKVTRTFAASAIDIANLTVYTFSGVSFSTEASDRKIVVGTGSVAGAAVNVTAVTVGGISATEVIALAVSNGAAELWQADVPTGATGDVVVTFAAAQNRAGIGVWAVYGAASAADDTASNGDDPMVASLNVPANGVAIGHVAQQDGGAVTWTNLTEDFDEETESGIRQTGASDEFATAQSGLSITADPVNPPAASRAMVLASWGPA